ncbi:MAG: FIG021250: possible hydrolase [uncultured Acidimicrobiales bacterium]|uniref:FIG021250: possible hydrolase n=1 Tax=uncultured Acidimicrobiales bacterium TaxID=310071 RepID=A0A6J4HBX5_9ACTN|nr:MAG: FIG021250: possible hydrolase [uncultured Acidimicrobiales bacterium]
MAPRAAPPSGDAGPRSPIGWDTAERVATRVAGREPLQDSYHYASLQTDFDELTAEAEHLVGETTGLVSAAGPARARVVDRAGWVTANVASFQRLLRPVVDRFAARMSGPAAPVGRAITGAQVGALLGFMSTRVLGQYDLLVLEDEQPEQQDLVYYVGPNILALEKRYSFPPREFRLWLALHEVTHRAQFTGVPWLRQHYLGLVEEVLDVADMDSKRLLDALRRVVDEVAHRRNPLAEGGLPGLLATAEQRLVFSRLNGLMSLLEGHGDTTMDRAGAARIPSAERFGRVLRQRRQQANPLIKLLLQAVGFEAKLAQYEAGERFIEAVEAEGGPALLDRVWERPQHLPSLEEVGEPTRWVARMQDSRPVSPSL